MVRESLRQVSELEDSIGGKAYERGVDDRIAPASVGVKMPKRMPTMMKTGIVSAQSASKKAVHSRAACELPPQRHITLASRPAGRDHERRGDEEERDDAGDEQASYRDLGQKP